MSILDYLNSKTKNILLDNNINKRTTESTDCTEKNEQAYF
jgi:hypothetical protein